MNRIVAVAVVLGFACAGKGASDSSAQVGSDTAEPDAPRDINVGLDTSSDTAPFTPAQFRVYNLLTYPKQPDLTPYGLAKMRIVYESLLIPDNWNAPAPEANVAREAARAVAAKVIVTLDIEQWEWDERQNPTGVGNSIDWYNGTMDLWKKHGGGLPVGWYGMPPIRDYWDPIMGSASAGYKKWQAANDRIKSIAVRCDVLYPSLYTFYTDQKGWVTYAVENIKEARRIAPGKPVLPFLWPSYHPGGDQKGFIPGGYWRLQLETMRTYADGVVLWGGFGEPTWDENAPWWQSTKDFMKTLE